MPTLCFRSLLPGLLLASLLGCQQMPEDLSTATPLRPAEQVELLFDQTWRDSQGQEHVQQQIMDRALELIDGANDLVVVDMFLFNDFAGEDSYRPLSSELTDALITARQRHPQMPVILITDPFNTLYGGVESAQFEALRGAGVDVVMTDLSQLPASNPTWTGIWTLCCSYLGNSTRGGWLPNPVGEGKVTLRTYLHLLNFRANHRKTLIVGRNGEWTGMTPAAATTTARYSSAARQRSTCCRPSAPWRCCPATPLPPTGQPLRQYPVASHRSCRC